MRSNTTRAHPKHEGKCIEALRVTQSGGLKDDPENLPMSPMPHGTEKKKPAPKCYTALHFGIPDQSLMASNSSCLCPGRSSKIAGKLVPTLPLRSLLPTSYTANLTLEN